MSSRAVLRNDAVFARFFAAHAISFTGTTITTIVMPIALYQRTGSAGWTALLTALQTVPYLMFGLLAGVVADRGRRRALMIGSDLIAAVVVGSVPLADAFGILTTGHLVVAAAGLATCFVWFDAANFGALPALVGRDLVVRAVLALWTFDSVALIGGPAVGALLATTFTPSIALTIDAVSYVVSAALVAGISRPFANNATEGAHASIRSDMVEGLRHLWDNRVLRALTFSGFANSVSFGAVLGLTVPFAVERLGLTDHDARIGLLTGVGALGSLVVALALPRIGGGKAIPSNTSFGLVGSALAMAAIAFTTNFGVALVLWPLWDSFVHLAILNGIAYRQQTLPDDMQGRVNVVARMVSWGGQPFGAALGGLGATVIGLRPSLLVLAAPVAVASVLSWRALRSSEMATNQRD